MMKPLFWFAVPLLLAGCSTAAVDDLQYFVTEAGRDLQGKVDPLPQVKAYEAFSYEAFEIPDPFRPRKLSTASGGGGLQPDLTRSKEPLETYSLETLQMVGLIRKKSRTHAVIKTPDNSVYHVHAGNYLGQNYGRITGIADNEVTLTEIIQDSAGDWAERVSTLTLQE
jgi:type IV pilus assembly protein PilP